MYCSKCGKKLKEDAKFCDQCGTKIETIAISSKKEESNQRNEVPKCTHCGYIGNWKIAPILRPVDYVIGIIFLFLGIVPGLIYIGVVVAIRSNEDNREKICPKCNAKNLWTFFY